jgi:protein TonB
LVVLLTLLLHALVLLAFYFRPADESIQQRQTIEISLETSAPTSAPVVEKRPAPLKPQRTETADAKPQPPLTPVSPPAQEAQPQTAPTPPVSNAPINPPPVEEIQPLFRLTRQPKPLGKIEPVYPASERRAGLQASVVAEVTIDSQGNIQNVRILKSAGNAFDAAVIEALRKSTFAPGYIGDKAVPVRFQVPFRFSLN